MTRHRMCSSYFCSLNYPSLLLTLYLDPNFTIIVNSLECGVSELVAITYMVNVMWSKIGLTA